MNWVASPAKKARTRSRPEDAVQMAILAYLRTAVPDSVVIHVANKPRSAIAGAREKALGALAGTPDLLVMLPRGRGLWIEVKSAKGTRQPNQDAFNDFCNALGWPCFVARSIDDVRLGFKALGIPTREAGQ